VEFRVVTPGDAQVLADVFSDIDQTFFRPHPFTDDEASLIASHAGPDVYAILLDGQRPVAYGMLRGWDEGYSTPSLGIAVRTSAQGRGLGRLMMQHLHGEAKRRGASVVRLRVHRDNTRARRLYESMGYRYDGEDRGELVMLLDLAVGAGAQPAQAATNGMEACLLDVDAPRWASFLRETPHDFYHLPAYVELCARHEDGEARALYVQDGPAAMLLPLIIRCIPGGDRCDAVSPYGYPGPLTSGTSAPEFLSAALAAGLTTLRNEGIVSVFVRLHPLLNASPPVGVGEVVLHGDTVSIDLTLPREARLALMRHNHRRDIGRAVRKGLRARMDPDFVRYDTFKQLYRDTMVRRAASPYYLFEDAYFDRLREALDGRLHLCLVEEDAAVAAAGLFVETDGIVQFHLAGADEAFRRLEPSKLMVDFAADWASARGNRYLHLGGGVGGVNDSLLYYKAGFSPLRHAFRTLHAVVDEAEYDRLVAAHEVRTPASPEAEFFPRYRAG
jgi:GNAT superfamily N-acetyltransferase